MIVLFHREKEEKGWQEDLRTPLHTLEACAHTQSVLILFCKKENNGYENFKSFAQGHLAKEK